MLETDRGSRVSARMGGSVLILATVIMATGAALPFFAPSLREAPWTDDPQQAATTIAGNPNAYAWANALFMVAGIVTALGLVPLSIGFRGSSRPWAVMGLVAFAFAAMFSTLDRLISIEVYTWGAVQRIDIKDPLTQSYIHLQSGLGHLFTVLAYLALGLYGVAMLPLDSREPGLVLISVAVLGLAVHLLGAGIPAFVYLGTATLGAAVWLFRIDSQIEA